MDNNWEKGIELYEEAINTMKISPDRGLYLAVMNCYALGKQNRKALDLFAIMKKQNMVSSTLYG